MWDAQIAHEGTHVVDNKKLIDSNYDTKNDISGRETEEHAYTTENQLLIEELGAGAPEWSSRKAIDKFVADHPALYPAPDAPILDPNAIP